MGVKQHRTTLWQVRAGLGATFLGAAAALFLPGCVSIGPGKVAQDRFDYTAALSDSWKVQMLLNMVKLRYGDSPIFLDVVSVINSYEVSGSADLSGNWVFQPDSGSGAGLGVRGFYANRPTITYSPLSGEKFSRNLMTPIPTSAIAHLIQSGYPADLVFRVLVQSVNGIQGRYTASAATRSGDPRFFELAEKIRRIQASGALGLKAQRRNGEEVLLVVFGRETDERTESDIADVKKALGLAPREREFRVVYGLLQADNKEISILTRSVLQVLGHLAAYIEVPELHVAEKRVLPTYREDTSRGTPATPLIRILSSVERPGDAFFSVFYHNHWFWIDDRDLPSKQIFSFMMFVFTLVESGGKDGSPVVTIPVR